jgi:hypothetical protein
VQSILSRLWLRTHVKAYSLQAIEPVLNTGDIVLLSLAQGMFLPGSWWVSEFDDALPRHTILQFGLELRTMGNKIRSNFIFSLKYIIFWETSYFIDLLRV